MGTEEGLMKEWGKKEKEGIGRNGIKREGKEGEEGKIKMGNLS